MSTERDWWRSSLCAQVDSAPFFPLTGDNAAPAKKICGLCSVRRVCLAETIAAPHEVEHGIFGGFGRETRRRLRERVHAGEAPMVVAAQAIAHERRRVE